MKKIGIQHPITPSGDHTGVLQKGNEVDFLVSSWYVALVC